RDCATIKDATETEMNTRNTMRDVVAYLKEACPVGFRNAFIYDIAPQLGTRGSCRLKGEYIMTPNDFAFAARHDDVIAWHSTICMINDCAPVEIPYRSILPQKVENLLAPGRHMSADNIAIDWLNLIPQCVGTGQAAGIAAAVAIEDGVNVRNVDIRKVQDILIDQDVPLPRNERVDKSYTEVCEAYEYGLYTELAKKARAEAEGLSEYRQSGIPDFEKKTY
ncbi:MAG: FAD-dependent oxidoreductase, partial [Clostridiales bacterium]|nr:FAD-dependent oxidoreductase [Clostridiales bacterium]